MANYCILDEEDYSNREYEATVENIADAAWRLNDDFELPRTGNTKAAIRPRRHCNKHS